MDARLPSLRGIQAFAHVAKFGSFRLAAERLNISISAISHRIHSLEEEIGLALFERVGRGMKLTRSGEVYRDKVLPLIDSLVVATDAAQREATDSSLRISSFQLFHSHWLSRRIGDFLRQQPSVRLELTSLKQEGVTNDINIRIIRPDEVTTEDDFISKFEISPVCLRNVYDKKSDPSKDIFQETLILTDVSVNLWKEWARCVGLEWHYPERFILVDSLPLSIELAAAGQGIAISANVFRAHTRALDLIHPVSATCDTLGSIYVNRASEREKPIVTKFRNWLKDQMG